VKIIYGYPDEDLFEEAERGDVALGGCCRPLGSPDRGASRAGTSGRALRARLRQQASRLEQTGRHFTCPLSPKTNIWRKLGK